MRSPIPIFSITEYSDRLSPLHKTAIAFLKIHQTVINLPLSL
ncbi:MAG: hypothetical protein ACK54J_02540 [Pseudanabaena sp.]